jgi:Tat protein translocase TatC
MSEKSELSPAVGKPFIEHLEELRIVLLKSALVLLVTTAVSFIFAPKIIQFLVWPLERVVQAKGGTLDAAGVLRTLRPTGGFLVGLKAAFLSGVIAALPFILYFFGGFVIPGLTKRERKVIFPAFSFSVILFIAGVSFCYFLILPFALKFFWGYSEGLGIRNEWIIENYISFAVQFLVAFGLVFELPCLMLALVKVGVLTHRMLKEKRKWAVVAVFIIAAAVTPTPDMITQVLVAVPMMLLYELCVWLAKWIESKDNRGLSLDVGDRGAIG